MPGVSRAKPLPSYWDSGIRRVVAGAGLFVQDSLWEGALGRDRLQPRVLPSGSGVKGQVNYLRQQKAQLLALLGLGTVALGTEGGVSTCWVPGSGARCTLGGISRAHSTWDHLGAHDSVSFFKIRRF